ncbi:MAG TPA: hypothetical protein VKY70_07580 [Pseudomonas sp.]|nr:hypothetical protein [Pseudomonas sp.]
MSAFDIESWCKRGPDVKSEPMGQMHFYISETDHVNLEQAEERLQRTGEKEARVDVDPATFDLKTPPECGALSEYHLRVYLRPEDERGQFHLVGRRLSDGATVYTNAIMIDMLAQ